ncbi:MAG: hypothetical protein LBV19_08975 [Streptococcaceae bacterium]|jgi:hypothetical protein|nr:hypothetical protein [Streptococcaceae bacterium]
MAYSLEERETLVRYDEMDDCWYFESNVRKHITRILRNPEAVEIIDRQLENSRIIWLMAKLKVGFTVAPFPRAKRILTDEEKTRQAILMKKALNRE